MARRSLRTLVCLPRATRRRMVAVSTSIKSASALKLAMRRRKSANRPLNSATRAA
jgi:hypothetical protein